MLADYILMTISCPNSSYALRRQTANMKADMASDMEAEGGGVQITQSWQDADTLDLTDVSWQNLQLRFLLVDLVHKFSCLNG